MPWLLCSSVFTLSNLQLYLSQMFYSYNEAKICLRGCLPKYIPNVARYTAISEVHFLFRNDVFVNYECIGMDLSLHLAVNKREMQTLWN